jgi:hypothetical protein
LTLSGYSKSMMRIMDGACVQGGLPAYVRRAALLQIMRSGFSRPWEPPVVGTQSLEHSTPMSALNPDYRS